MADDTRDIAITTRTEMRLLTEKVDRLTGLVETMHGEMRERTGAEKVARWMIGGIASVGGGAAGAAMTKIGTALMHTPMPK